MVCVKMYHTLSAAQAGNLRESMGSFSIFCLCTLTGIIMSIVETGILDLNEIGLIAVLCCEKTQKRY